MQNSSLSIKFPAILLAVILTLSAVWCIPTVAAVKAADKTEAKPKVHIETHFGNIVIELYPDKAPITVKNFLDYVDSGFYDGTLFHRVIDNFMIQGGGYTLAYKRKDTKAPILNEANNGLKNERGTIAMARTGVPHSATSQFFINVKHNTSLDFRHEGGSGWGYAVFGKVISGMDIVDKIKVVKTGSAGPLYKDAPAQQIVIRTISRLKP